MRFKEFYIAEMAGNPSTTFGHNMKVENPYTGMDVDFNTHDYDASTEYSPLLKSLFGPDGIREKGQEGIPRGKMYPYWDRSSNHIFIVYGGPQAGGTSEYEDNMKHYNQQGIFEPQSKSDWKDLIAKGVDMSIFTKTPVEKKHFSRKAETPEEKKLARELQRAIIAHRDAVGNPYAIQNAEGIEDAII